MFHVMSTAGASILGIGYLIPAIYLTLSLFNGEKAPANPWSATGLEWQTPSPPSTHNFDTTPVVVCGPYEYAIGVDQTGHGLPEPPGPGAADMPHSHLGTTGEPGPMHKETEVVG
jgi:cytochrome c oxidase subunit 1